MGRHFTARLRSMPVLIHLRLISCCLVLAMAGPAVAAPPTSDGPAVLHKGPLGATIAGEFALQAGKLDEAARWYLDAARTSNGDAGLAERATRIALLADDNARAT